MVDSEDSAECGERIAVARRHDRVGGAAACSRERHPRWIPMLHDDRGGGAAEFAQQRDRGLHVEEIVVRERLPAKLREPLDRAGAILASPLARIERALL